MTTRLVRHSIKTQRIYGMIAVRLATIVVSVTIHAIKMDANRLYPPTPIALRQVSAFNPIKSESNRFKAVLTDLTMTGMNGLKLGED
jgi:hypothetical protein